MTTIARAVGASITGCLGEAPTADAVGLSKEAGHRVPLAYASGWTWPLLNSQQRLVRCGLWLEV